jgi:uncharacterized protein YihD (DUF1040 family)
MSKFSVKDIQFMNKDLCAGYPKELAYLWFVANARHYPNAPYQTIFRHYPLTNQSKDEIIRTLIDSYQQELNVSTKCKYIVFVHEFLDTYYSYESDLEPLNVLPKYSVETAPISNIHDELPDNVCVWELNHIAPALTGMFYENMLNYIIADSSKPNAKKQLFKRMNSECNNLESILYGDQHNISTSSILSLLYRHFMNNDSMKYKLLRPIVKNKTIFIEYHDELSKLEHDHFRNRYYYILWISFLHFLKRTCQTGIIVDVLNAIDYINSNMQILNEYYLSLSRSTLVRKLMTRYNTLDIEHGTSFITPRIRGEVDFITPNSVIDIKCYKTDEIELWAGQLFLYMQLAQGTTGINDTERNIIDSSIVNLFTNEMHTYKFDKRVSKWTDDVETMANENDESTNDDSFDENAELAPIE